MHLVLFYSFYWQQFLQYSSGESPSVWPHLLRIPERIIWVERVNVAFRISSATRLVARRGSYEKKDENIIFIWTY